MTSMMPASSDSIRPMEYCISVRLAQDSMACSNVESVSAHASRQPHAPMPASGACGPVACRCASKNRRQSWRATSPMAAMTSS